ncbi:CehA/McbA family metallohydrolase [Streptomyces lunaelactis]|uniref:CehA/McbA family metallohydrolase n=1 Tax=Streptomyces lunaelactis TaxID=1535768 RepID=UPI00158577B5|nr:CehA/McbA family metallohydrolase [Streptomyces lunaelactis]NUK54634.1 CehA/McbA family metallohydrolase [Streptomyces lunaelactis]NUK68332.1 CehA/McbA family metallohydrolase [Streptomyces lunaelactis]NUK75160.1 CehA/McbA family metallohydrolase [Streptomyces lunaelactis]NUK78424.1 CehA/McbA family metallohydrolase [Streptomyces lunaelactis]
MCNDEHAQHAMDRRGLLVTGAAAALTLGTVRFAYAAPNEGAPANSEPSEVVRGTLPPGSPDFVYLPVEIPKGVREIHVAYTYERPVVPPGTQGNALDIGIFDERGTGLGGKGFRGWSGGARTEFFIRADEATPGYIPGPLRAGTWYIALGPYTVSPQGLAYEVTITLRYGAPGKTPKPVYPPERAKGRGRAWYRGDCHLHSWYSDGKRTPAEIAALARAAGLDFINTSEHNTHSAHAHWADQAGDDLLILTGEEVTTRNGHVIALGTDPGTFVDWRYRARDNRFGHYAREIRRAGGLVVPAHPHATCIGCNWKFGFGEADAVEVWNGPFTPDDEVSLQSWDNTLVASVRSGKRWTPAMGNSDAHRDPDPIGTPQTVVLADDLTREAILEGIRAGRSYVAESKAVSLSFSAAGGRGRHAGIGERLHVDPDDPVTVRLEVAGAPGCSVRFVTDQGVLHTAALPASGAGTVEWGTTAQYAAYVRAEVRRPPAVPVLPGALAAFTNPVFLGD